MLNQIPGVGPLIASAVAASVPDPAVLKSGRDFAAWLGLTPRQNSSGGKEKLGPITKQGNRYIRKMLVVGARSVLRVAGRRTGALADWINALRSRKPERLVVALANKLARICWALMTSGESFRAQAYQGLSRGIAAITRTAEPLFYFEFGRKPRTPRRCHEHQARRNDRNQGRRNSSGPADIAPYQKAGHMTDADQIIREVKKALPIGAVHI